jgi:hypothetical protein
MNFPDNAAGRIRATQAGIRAFLSGIAGVVPLLGIPFAVDAIFHWRRSNKTDWNPASEYARAGAFLGLLGLMVSLGIILVAVVLSFAA